MNIGFDSPALKLLAKNIRRLLLCILGNHHTADVEIHAAQVVYQAQYIQIVGNAKIRTDLIFFNIPRIDAEDNFRLVFEALEELGLAIYVKPGQHPRSMVIIEQLPAEFKVQLPLE